MTESSVGQTHSDRFRRVGVSEMKAGHVYLANLAISSEFTTEYLLVLKLTPTKRGVHLVLLTWVVKDSTQVLRSKVIEVELNKTSPFFVELLRILP